jgi:cytochrome c-type biogenesis protein CcmH/NrfG
MGGADLIFQRPPNPPTKKRKKPEPTSAGAAQEQKLAPDGAAKPEASSTEKPTASANPKTSADSSDEVEDALSLGNAARDRKPPDLASAEKAYRLAWKLKPTDPRPFIGLGNVYLDQERYPEAAKAYKEAIRLTTPNTTSVGVSGLLGKKSGGGGAIVSSSTAMSAEVSDLRVFAIAALLRQDKLLVAERELKSEIAAEPTNVRLRALLGYDLFTQKRYAAAAETYKSALALDRNNDSHKTAMEESTRKSVEASARDATIAKDLERSKWTVGNEGRSGRCEFKTMWNLSCELLQKPQPQTGSWTWKIQDSVVELQGYPSSGSFCFGMLEGDRLEMKCLVDDAERTEVWTRMNKH